MSQRFYDTSKHENAFSALKYLILTGKCFSYVMMLIIMLFNASLVLSSFSSFHKGNYSILPNKSYCYVIKIFRSKI